MAVTTVAGPFKSKSEADDTAASLGKQYCSFGRHLKDAEGFTTDVCEYFVERDDSILPDTIFGYDAKQFMARQYK